MRKLMVVAVLCLVFGIHHAARAQQVDLAIGVSTVTAPSAIPATGNNFGLPSESGGAYPVISGAVLMRHRLGVSGEVTWRGSQALYGGFQPYRPILYDFNAIWSPQIGKHAGAELMAGVGAESLRFYTPFTTCNFVSCTNFVSSNHFMGHFGGGVRFYVHGGFFVRPEAHLYLIRNNVEFSSDRLTRFGISIGYSFFAHEQY